MTGGKRDTIEGRTATGGQAGTGKRTNGTTGKAGERAVGGGRKADGSGGAAATMPKKVRREWTDKRRRTFLDHLARTCSVSHSLKMVAMSPGGYYHLRTRDAGFREQVSLALQTGYEQVEANLLAHALAQGGAVEDGESGAVAVPAFDPEVSLKLLQLRNRDGADRRPPAGASVKRATEREIEDALVAKLGKLARRLALER